MTRLAKFQPVEMSITKGPRTSFGDAVGAGFDSALTMGSVAEVSRQNEIYGGWNQIFGMIRNSNLEVPEPLLNNLYEQDFQPDDETLNGLSEWLQNHERLAPSYTDDMAPGEVLRRRDEVLARDKERIDRQQEVLDRASPFARNVGGLVGSVGAEFLDPVNLSTLPFGASARAGLLATVLIEAGANATIEAAQTPSRNAIARRLGQPETSVLENAAIGALFGGAFAGVIKGGELGVRQAARIGRMIPARRPLIEAAEASGNDEAMFVASTLRMDEEDESAAVTRPGPFQVREHTSRAQSAREALEDGQEAAIPDRPTNAVPRGSIIGGEIEEVNPAELEVQPDVFQFKSDTVAEGGVTRKLQGVTEWQPERAGIAIVYEYQDGTRAIADGHQRTALARRISEQTGEPITMAAKVYREADGFTVDDIRALAALKNISEAADGMTTAMARDAAKVLRVRPEAIEQLPAGSGIARAKNLSRLSDEAFDMLINEVVPERFAELVGRMVENPELHGAMMQLLRRTSPDTTAQAESILAQALEAPVSRETTSDLFGEQEIVESLYVERAKVLERAMRIMREDRSIFRTLDERAERIEGTGQNRLDAATNKERREQLEQSLAAVQKLAHRAGAISEALNDGAKGYKESGRLKDAAQSVVDAVRSEIERNGLAGARAGDARPNAKPARASAAAPDPLEGFSDPVEGEAAQAQIEATRIAPTAAPPIERLPEMSVAESAKLEADLKAAQGLKDVGDLMARGARNHAELTDQIEVAAQEAGVTARAAPLKGRDRTEQKIRDKYAGDVNRVTDVARGGVDVPTQAAGEAFVAALSRRYRIIDEGWNLVEGGYFDRKLTVVFDDGQLGEVQMWVPGMFEVKEGKGHKLYEVYRDPSYSDAERAQALRDMEELYEGVMDQLPDEWRGLFQETPGTDAPSSATTSTNVSSETSGDPSSARTSDGTTVDQPPDADSNSIEPVSSSIAGMDRSTRKNRMGDTSNADIEGGKSLVNTERTNAGDQGLFDGVEPITERTRLEAAQGRALDGGQRDSDTEIGGLFDPNDPSRVDLFDMVPVDRAFDADGNEIAVTKSRADVAAELDADDDAIEAMDLCLRG